MTVVDQCVRLGMAIVIIALISLALYQFGNRAQAAGQAAGHAVTVAHGVSPGSVRN